METGLISVIIPVYNTEPYLRECMNSVLNQSYNKLEIICIDDGSTDCSFALLESYAKSDPRIVLLHQTNSGQGKARNKGLSLANGEYIIFLDSDDWFEPDFLEGMLQKAQETNADITICCSDEFDTKTGKYGSGEWMLKKQYLKKEVFSPNEIADHLFQFTYGWAWDKLYRSVFLINEEITFPDLPNSEDLVFVFSSLTVAERLAVAEKAWIHHRVCRSSSVSNSRMRAPEAPYTALCLLRQALMERKIYEEYEKSFLNWSMEFLVWNAANLGSLSAQRNYIRKLKSVWIPQLNFERYGSSFYENKFMYCKYLLLRHFPWPVFSAVVGLYHFCKRWRNCFS